MNFGTKAVAAGVAVTAALVAANSYLFDPQCRDECLDLVGDHPVERTFITEHFMSATEYGPYRACSTVCAPSRFTQMTSDLASTANDIAMVGLAVAGVAAYHQTVRVYNWMATKATQIVNKLSQT